MAAKTGTYTLIASSTASGSSNSVTFSSIPGTYTDLVLVLSANVQTATDYLRLRINSDTGSNYSYTFVYGTGSTAASSRQSNVTSVIYNAINTGSSPNISIIQFMDYSNTTTNKTFLTRNTVPANETNAFVALWRSTSAITSITIDGTDGRNFTSGSTFKLYGIEAGNL
jgi:hypothetical protein